VLFYPKLTQPRDILKCTLAYWNWVVQHSEKSSEIFSDIDEAMNQLDGVEM